MLEVTVVSRTGVRRPLSSYGTHGQPSFSSLWRREGGCGDFAATVTLNAPTGPTPVGLGVGSRMDIHDTGLLVFSGEMTAPEQGSPWRLTAFGAVTQKPLARGLTIADDAVDAAIAGGWPVTRPTSLSTVALPGGGGTGDVPYVTVVELLDALAQGGPTRWGVNVNREVFLRDDATTPTWVYTDPYAAQGVAEESYASLVEVFYVKALAGTPPVPSEWDRAYASNAASAAEFGPAEVFVDVTDRGLLSSGEADILADAILANLSPRPHYDTPFVATKGNLVHFASGAPGLPSQVRAGDVVRMTTVFDQSGLSLTGTVADILLGEVEHDGEAGETVCTPFDGYDRSLLGAVDRAWSSTDSTRRERFRG